MRKFIRYRFIIAHFGGNVLENLKCAEASAESLLSNQMPFLIKIINVVSMRVVVFTVML